MSRLLASLLLIAGCSQAPAPAASPTPPPKPIPRYTLVGIFTIGTQCSEPMPSAIAMNVTLADPAANHKVASTVRRIGLMGRSYAITVDWPTDWAPPTQWQDLAIKRFDGTPLCSGSCSAGNSCREESTLAPAHVIGADTHHDLNLQCNCTP